MDANVLIRGLDHGELDKVDQALAGRAPVISPQAQAEYLTRGDQDVFDNFMNSRGGRIGAEASESEAQALRDQARTFTDQFGNRRSLGEEDAFVVASALKDNVPLISADKQVINFLRAIGHPVEVF